MSRGPFSALQMLFNRHLAWRDETKRVLVVGSGVFAFRGYILQRLHSAGYPISLITDGEPEWELAFADRFEQAPFDQPDAVLAAARRLDAAAKLKGVLTYVERNVPLTAYLARELGLLCYPLAAAERARDKLKMRIALQAAGVRVPQFEHVTCDLHGAVARIGLPAVFKPQSGEGSIHVLKLSTAADVASAEALLASRPRSKWAYGEGSLIEEYVDGDEYSVESIVSRGHIVHAAVTDKDKTAEPFFEEIGHTSPSRVAPELARELFEAAGAAIRALGLDNCATHCELKASKKGITVIEIASRLGGDRIPALVELATRFPMARAAADAALGRPLPPPPEPHASFASVGFFVPAKAQRQSRSLAARPELPGVTSFELWSKAGDELQVPPNRFMERAGYVVTVGHSHAEARARRDAVRTWVEQHTGLALLGLA